MRSRGRWVVRTVLVRVPGAVAANSVRLAAAVLRTARPGGGIGADRELVLPVLV